MFENEILKCKSFGFEIKFQMAQLLQWYSFDIAHSWLLIVTGSTSPSLTYLNLNKALLLEGIALGTVGWPVIKCSTLFQPQLFRISSSRRGGFVPDRFNVWDPGNRRKMPSRGRSRWKKVPLKTQVFPSYMIFKTLTKWTQWFSTYVVLNIWHDYENGKVWR